MAKEIKTESVMNALFKFNEKDHIAGFYQGVVPVKHGECMLISNLKGDKVAGVPMYTVLKRLPDRISEGDFVLLMYKGEETSKGGQQYMNISSRAWKLEESELSEWDSEKCNVPEVIEAMPDWKPSEPEGKDPEDAGISDDELPF